MKKLKTVFGILLSAYLIMAGLLFIYQGNLLYHPSVEISHTFHTQKFTHDNETLNVIVINAGMDNAIIYFGGNAEAVVGNAIHFFRAFSDQTVYLTNYRGFGGSTGVPKEAALYKDAEYIFDKVSSQHQKVSIIGRSLGTGVATFVASSREVDKLVLVTPYDSILHIAQDQFPIFPLSILLTHQFNSVDRVNNIKAQTLVILAENDLVIPEK